MARPIKITKRTTHETIVEREQDADERDDLAGNPAAAAPGEEPELDDDENDEPELDDDEDEEPKLDDDEDDDDEDDDDE